MSLVWTPTIKRTMARMVGHSVSVIDVRRILPQKSIQRYQIAPIAQMGFQGNEDSASLPFNSFKPPHSPFRDAVIPRLHQLEQRHINQRRRGKRQRIRSRNNTNPHKQPNGSNEATNAADEQRVVCEWRDDCDCCVLKQVDGVRATSGPFKGASCAYVRNANPAKQKQNGDSREETWEVRVESVDAKVGAGNIDYPGTQPNDDKLLARGARRTWREPPKEIAEAKNAKYSEPENMTVGTRRWRMPTTRTCVSCPELRRVAQVRT